MKSYLPAAVLAFVLALASSYMAFSEFRVARWVQQPEQRILLSLLERPPRRALSVRSDDAVLSACEKALSGHNAALQPARTQMKMAARCRVVAAKMVQSSPWFGYAHYVLALAAYRAQDKDALGNNLVVSQAVSAYESWLARRRVALGFEAAGQLPAEAQAALERDIVALLQSPKGQHFLARYFAGNKAYRPRILRLAETLDQDIQARFLKNLTVEMKRRARVR